MVIKGTDTIAPISTNAKNTMLWAAILTLCVPTLKDRMYVDVFEAFEEMGETAQILTNASTLNQTTAVSTPCAQTPKEVMFAAALEDMKAMEPTAQMSMNVPILNQMTVIRMLCVPTLKVPTCVIVSKDTLETASVVQKNCSVIFRVAQTKFARIMLVSLSVFAKTDSLGRTTAEILMNVQTNLKITVIRTHYVPIPRDLTFAAVKEDLKEMAKNV